MATRWSVLVTKTLCERLRELRSECDEHGVKLTMTVQTYLPGPDVPARRFTVMHFDRPDPAGVNTAFISSGTAPGDTLHALADALHLVRTGEFRQDGTTRYVQPLQLRRRDGR